MRTLSKSRFVSGIQCEKKLWFDLNRKDLKMPVSKQTQALFDLGHRIGELAKSVFPGGKDATPVDYSDLRPSIENTKTWLNGGETTIYEATFSSGSAFCMLDILHRNGEGLTAIEVKNSTSVKDYHITDASLQYFVMKSCGFTPDRFYLMHINNQYIRQGEITTELFHCADITAQVLANQGSVADNIDRLLYMLAAGHEPEKQIGGHCSSPFGCDYTHHCWQHIPDDSVFELYRGGEKGWSLYDSGILKITDIDDTYPLTHFQTLQRNGLLYQQRHFNKKAVRDVIGHWQFPLYFFDFETLFPAIPVLNGTRPYQQVPFQYSLHILEGDGTLTHKEFLASPEDFHNGGNPLQQMIQQLKLDFGARGSIVTYNQGFEKARLNELAAAFPADGPFLKDLVSRIVDLLPVFQKGHCYLPAMKNSASIKSVLPAIAPDFAYDNLQIQDGGTASNLFHMAIEQRRGLSAELRENLLEYCKRDTMAMVIVYRYLEEELHGN